MAYFEIVKEFKFEAMHCLPLHDGKCARPHGHSYICRLTLRCATLVEDGPKLGMVQDFGDVSEAMEPLLSLYLDHHNLNETLVGCETTTAENIALWLFNRLIKRLPLLCVVEIDETRTSTARYVGVYSIPTRM